METLANKDYHKNLTKTSIWAQSYPWIVISLSALFLLYKYILQVSPSVMTNELMQTFHVTGAGLGNLSATYFYSYAFTQLFVGLLLDRFSLRWLTGLAIGICALGAIGFAHADSLSLALLYRALMGVGVAFATVSYMKATAVWFRAEQFAFVSGLLATAAMAGALFGEAPLALLVTHEGWRQSLVYCGVLGFVISVLFVLVVRDKKNSTPLALFTPLEGHSASSKGFLLVLKNRKNWLLTFYSGLAFAPLAVFGGLWGNGFLAEAYHLSHTQAASYTSLAFLGLAVGSPALGWLSDKLGQRYSVMVGSAILSLVALVIVLYCNQLPLIVVQIALFLFGFGTGAFILGFAIGKELNQVVLAATVIAMINTGDALLGAVTEPITGKFLDFFWDGKMLAGARYFSLHDYHLALLLLPIYILAALGFLGWCIKEQDTIR